MYNKNQTIYCLPLLLLIYVLIDTIGHGSKRLWLLTLVYEGVGMGEIENSVFTGSWFILIKEIKKNGSLLQYMEEPEPTRAPPNKALVKRSHVHFWSLETQTPL